MNIDTNRVFEKSIEMEEHLKEQLGNTAAAKSVVRRILKVVGYVRSFHLQYNTQDTVLVSYKSLVYLTLKDLNVYSKAEELGVLKSSLGYKTGYTGIEAVRVPKKWLDKEWVEYEPTNRSLMRFIDADSAEKCRDLESEAARLQSQLDRIYTHRENWKWSTYIKDEGESMIEAQIRIIEALIIK